MNDAVQLSSDEEAETECSDVTDEVAAVTDTHQVTSDDRFTVKRSASVAADNKTVADAEDWLRQNVVVQYWNGECDTRQDAVCRFPNIAVDWFVFTQFLSCVMSCLCRLNSPSALCMVLLVVAKNI